MATSKRVKSDTCYRCNRVLKKTDIIVDDEPWGMLCLGCEDSLYGKWMDIGDDYPLTEH